MYARNKVARYDYYVSGSCYVAHGLVAYDSQAAIMYKHDLCFTIDVSKNVIWSPKVLKNVMDQPIFLFERGVGG